MRSQASLVDAINKVTQRQDLSSEAMTAAMKAIMTGQGTDAQIGGFLIGLRMKGETVDEVAAAASVMRELASSVKVNAPNAVDIVGTGGDGSGTFNVSTASIFVAAAAGVTVAKHGNRSVSSRSGAADLLEMSGVDLSLSPDQVAECINELGVGFMFAQQHHSAMKHAIGVRKEMAVRTIFNVLGPLTNPAGVRRQVLGVFSTDWVLPLAQVLQSLGSEHVMVVHANNGMDEIGVASATQVAELKEGTIREYTLNPQDFGIALSSQADIQVDSPEASLAMVQQVFANQTGAARDIVALNAGAAIYVSGLADSHQAGVEKALAVIAAGDAQRKMDDLVAMTQRLAKQA